MAQINVDVDSVLLRMRTRIGELEQENMILAARIDAASDMIDSLQKGEDEDTDTTDASADPAPAKRPPRRNPG